MPALSALGYLVASLAFLVVTIVLAVGWRGRALGGLLLTALALSALWGAGLAGLQWAGHLSLPWIGVADACRFGAWLAFLFGLVRSMVPRRVYRGLLAVALMGLAIELASGLSLLAFPVLGRTWVVPLPVGAGLVMAVLGLLLMEQIYRLSRFEARWALKYLFLGLGTLFVFDLFLFADALLMRRPDPELWAARGYINALVAPLVAVSASRNLEWSLNAYVSRRFVLHTASLLGAGAYLLVMALVAYAIRFYGGVWGGPIQVVFLVGALVLLLILLFSGQIRARARVFLSKHFYNYRYDYREEWLRFTRTLTAEEVTTPLKERVIHAVAQVVESPAGILCQERDGWVVPTARWNLAESGEMAEPTDGELARLLREQEWVLVLDEWHRYPERYRGMAIPAWLQELPRAWLVVPLLHREQLEGFLVLTRSRAGNLALNWEDFDLLKTLGRQAASYLAQEAAAEALGRARQFETFNRLSAFILHDLKNVIGQLSMLARNARRHGHDPQFMADAVTTIEHAVERMNSLMAQLRGGVPSQRIAEVELAQVLRQAVRQQEEGRPVPEVTLSAEGLWLEADRGRLVAVLGHAIQNAQDATPDNGSVQVRLAKANGEGVVDVVDTGVGMASEFVREHLFQPFDSSKGDVGMGIGAYEAREYARELGGDVEVHSTPGVGTRFRFRFPIQRETVEGEQAKGEMAQ